MNNLFNGKFIGSLIENLVLPSSTAHRRADSLEVGAEMTRKGNKFSTSRHCFHHGGQKIKILKNQQVFLKFLVKKIKGDHLH